MYGVAMSPKAGAHGELCGLLCIRAALEARGDKREVVLVPESAHGTNPATAAFAGYRVESIPANAAGRVDLDALKSRLGVDVADDLLEKLKQQSDRKGPVFKMENDPRVTKFGKILRRLSIDELPQLINVLKGDMSLVGPRPQVLWEASAYNDWAKRRLRTLPGITGLWQVSGRASLSYEEMIELDIYYIENWSCGLDLEILFSTIPAVFTSKGAY
jgi:hypothetical protein